MYRALILVLIVVAFTQAQVTPRNILSGHFRADEISQNLIPRNKWLPYPKTGVEWRARLPETAVQEIIKRGEQYLGKDVPAISGDDRKTLAFGWIATLIPRVGIVRPF